MPLPSSEILLDYEGRPIRLTAERQLHILEHPEMRPLQAAIGRTLAAPDRVVRSSSDPGARLYYRYHQETPVGRKHVCVVVKALPVEAFVITAYLTDSIKPGETLWPAPN